MRARVHLNNPVHPPARAGGQQALVGSLSAMAAWEYATAPLLIHNTKAILDNWGEDGWELVTVIPGPEGQGLVAYFKRPRS